MSKTQTVFLSQDEYYPHTYIEHLEERDEYLIEKGWVAAVEVDAQTLNRWKQGLKAAEELQQELAEAFDASQK